MFFLFYLLCPCRHFFHSMFFQSTFFIIQHFVHVGLVYFSASCPCRRFFQSTFFTIRHFVPVDAFLHFTFFPVNFFTFFDVLSQPTFFTFNLLSHTAFFLLTFVRQRFLLRGFVGESCADPLCEMWYVR